VTLQPLVDRHAILGFEKLMHAGEVIGDAPWWVDLDAGRIVFGGELEIRAGLIGTEAGRWLWAWASPGSYPEPVVADALALREQDVPELREPQLALSEDVSLDRIALVAMGVLGLDAAYSGALDEDARILLGLRDASLALPEHPPLPALLPAVLEAGVVRDWPAALAAYAQQRGLALDELNRLAGSLRP
jgi:hypothetical protein